MADTQQSLQRLANLGRLSELRNQEKRLRYTVDGLAHSILDLFEPRDRALTYTFRIDLTGFDTFTTDLRSRVIELRQVRSEIDALRGALGIEE